MLKLEEV